MDRELLLEIGVEELPASWLPGLTKQLAEKLQSRLTDMRLTPDVPVESFATPRRLTARVGRMPERQEDLHQMHAAPLVSLGHSFVIPWTSSRKRSNHHAKAPSIGRLPGNHHIAPRQSSAGRRAVPGGTRLAVMAEQNRPE